MRTFTLRRGRVTAGQSLALARLWPVFGVEVDGSPLDLGALFGRAAPVVLEIGHGMGEATALSAAAEPERNLLTVDVHTPGHGNLLRLIEAAGLTNVRVADGDALVLLRRMLAPASLEAVRLLFPDPWPKTRHHKRRLFGPAFAALVASRLRPGGVLQVATDSAPYAAQVRAVLDAEPALGPGGPVPSRPPSRFEGQARAAGRAVHEIVARRTA